MADVPGYVQYARWLAGIFRQGSLGESLMGRGTVAEQIISRFPVTLELGLLAIVIGLVIALPVGFYSAIHQDTVTDYSGRTIAILGLATPNFWLALWPGLCLTMVVFSLNMFGDAVRDPLDPRLRGEQGSYGAATGKRKRGFLDQLINPFN